MRLRVENLGPLREADVDLSQDLIVLTGPNNTGKTWFAWTVYALVRDAVQTTASLLPHQKFVELATTRTVTINAEEIKARVEGIASSATMRVNQSLPDIFASSRQFFAASRLEWRLSRDQDESVSRRRDPNDATFSVVEREENWSLRGSFLKGSTAILLEVLSANGATSETLPPGVVALAQAAARLLASLCLVPHQIRFGATLFPAERLAVNLFARELAASRSELVDAALAADEKGQDAAALIRRAGRFPLPIRDSLSVATRLDVLSRFDSPFADLAAELETSLLGGAIRASEHGELHFAPRDSNVSLPVHMTASVVKSLASLVFYFRYLARPEAFLIIDEPELNLHPDAQRKVARFLGKVVNRGFKVMISTHSDFVVRELSHLVMLGHAGDAGRSLAQELGYDHDALLTPDKVGAWLFNEGTAARIPVDGTGFGVRTIDDEISHMNADSQRIYARLVG